MDLLGPAVATIASLKNSEIVSMTWTYPDIEQTKREILQEAVRLAKEATDPVEDLRGPADFKRHAAGVMVQRAVARARERASA